MNEKTIYKLTSFLTFIIRHVKSQPMFFVAIVVCFFIFSFFGELVDDVLEGDSHVHDERILMWFRDADNIKSPIGPPWLEEMMRDFTALGGIGILSIVSVASIIYLIVIEHKRRALYLFSVVCTGTVLANVMKIGFDRPRPDLVPHDSITYMSGFPSGHSFMATVVYLTLGAILAEAAPRKSLKFFMIGLAIFVSLLVGISRVYLGVHWPSDVLAGWLIGTGWALLFWIIARYLEIRNILKKDKSSDKEY